VQYVCENSCAIGLELTDNPADDYSYLYEIVTRHTFRMVL
jgi:hypothetical protein